MTVEIRPKKYLLRARYRGKDLAEDTAAALPTRAINR